MKKIIYLFSVLFLLLASCSNDDNDSNSNAVLLKKTIVHFDDVSNPLEITYQYQGNKLMRINYGTTSYITHTYTGDLITRAAQYYNNGPLLSETFNEYDSQQRLVVSKILIYGDLDDSAAKTIFTYNADATVSYEDYTGDFTSQTLLRHTGKIWLNADGENIKTEEYTNGVLNRKEVFTHDAKNELFKSVAGFNKSQILSGFGLIHNVLTRTTYDANDVVTNGSTRQFIYNANDYPASATTTSNTGSVSTAQYFY